MLLRFVLLNCIQALSEQLIGAKGQLIGHFCDVTDNDSVKETFDWIETEFGGVNVVVNNAGIGRFGSKIIVLTDR